MNPFSKISAVVLERPHTMSKVKIVLPNEMSWEEMMEWIHDTMPGWKYLNVISDNLVE